MVTIKKRLIGNQEYYYLEHTVRKKGSVGKEEVYLGKKIPKDIENIKRDFLSNIYKEKWHAALDKIKTGYSKELSIIPQSAWRKEKQTFAIKFTYNSQKIEGSKLTYRETADLLENGITPKSRPINDVKEAEAHKKVFYEMLEYKKDLSLQIVLYWHKTLFEATKQDIAGKIRQHQVAISGSKFLPPYPAEVYPLLEEFFSWYKREKGKLHPVELAALTHLKFVTIHPFSDGNGRASRLLMNFILNRHNYPLLDIQYVNRSAYYNALERSQTTGNANIFLVWFIKKYIKENNRYVRNPAKH